MDSTSPKHAPFQLYDDELLLDCPLNPFACYCFYQEMEEHKADEATITPEQLRQSIQLVRENYRKVYGDRALEQAVGIFSSLLFLFNKYVIDGRQMPGTVKIDDLGTVTIRGDGKEEYKGPLEKDKK